MRRAILSICHVVLLGLLGLGCSEDTAGPPPVTTVWPVSAGGTLVDLGLGATTDASSNVIIVGSFEGRPDFGGTSLTSRGASDIFVAKYSPGGSLLWVKSAGGTGGAAAWNAATDPAGNIFVTGYFAGTATFDGIPIQSAALDTNVFVAKYDPSGNVAWVRGAGSTGTDRARGIAVDGMGNVVVAGYFRTTITFGGTTLTTTGTGTDIFLTKYDNAGNVLWTQSAGGTVDDKAWGVTTDFSNNIIMTGFFQGTATFGSQMVTGSGNEDIFVAKFAPDSSLVWAETATGTGINRGWDVATDASGSVLVTGSITGTASFGGIGVTGYGDLDAFVAKYTSTGGFAWVRLAGGTGSDEALGIGVDGLGNAVIGGFYNTSASFGATILTSAGGDDAFFAKYDPFGVLVWVQSAGGTGQDAAFDGTVDGSGNLIGTGQFENIANFGGTNLTSAGAADVFVLKGGAGGL